MCQYYNSKGENSGKSLKSKSAIIKALTSAITWTLVQQANKNMPKDAKTHEECRTLCCLLCGRKGKDNRPLSVGNKITIRKTSLFLTKNVVL